MDTTLVADESAVSLAAEYHMFNSRSGIGFEDSCRACPHDESHPIHCVRCRGTRVVADKRCGSCYTPTEIMRLAKMEMAAYEARPFVRFLHTFREEQRREPTPQEAWDAAMFASDASIVRSAVFAIVEEERCHDNTGHPTDVAVNALLDRISAALGESTRG